MRRRGAAARAWLAAHPLAAAGLAYLLVDLVMVGRGLLPGHTLSGADLLWSTAPWRAGAPAGIHPRGTNLELADVVTQFEPFLQHTRQTLPHVPLWNPNVMAGRPFLGDGQSAVLSPFSLPAYILPFAQSLAAAALLKLWVAAMGTYVLGRTLGMRFGGALVAGLVFSLGTFLVAWLTWPLANVFVLIPWTLVALERVVRRPGLGAGALLATVTALQFLGGHPESSFHLLVVSALWLVARALPGLRAGGEPRRAALRAGLVSVAAVAGGAVLAAAALVPLAEFVLHSGDYATRTSTAPGHADPRFLGAFFLSDYWGRPTQTPLVYIVSNRGYYAGGLTLMAAAAALVLRPARQRLAVAALGALALLVAVGAQPFFVLVTHLPGFRAAHNGRLVIYTLLALALLAGWGLDDLATTARWTRRRGQVVAGAAAALFVFPVLWMLAAGSLHLSRLGAALRVAWGFEHPPLAPGSGVSGGLFTGGLPPVHSALAAVIRLSALLEWLPLAGAALLLVGGRALGLRVRGRALGPAAFLALAALVVAADLLRANAGFLPVVPTARAHQPVTPAVTYLRRQRPNRFVGADRIAGQPLEANLAMRYGLYDARGYDYPVERRYDDLWRSGLGPPGDFRPPTTGALVTAQTLPGLGLLSVADVIQDPSDPPLHLRGLPLVYSAPDARIYRNTFALPRAFLVDRQTTVGGRAAALLTVRGGHVDLRRSVVTERPIPGLPAAPGAGAAPPVGTARIAGYGDESAGVDVDARRAGLLVLTDTFYPGWKATVDGRPAPIHRVDYLLRGVSVPAGRHRVLFTYAPASWRIGWIVSLVALAGLAGVALLAYRRRSTA